MSKRIILFTCLLLMSAIGFAQTKTVKGKVTDENGAALPAVNITPRGSRQGTQTDAQGNFSITVASGTTVLNISSVGFAAQQVSIAGKDNITVVMQSVVAREDEVVVIGYQSIKRKDLTGSVSSVGAKDIKDIPLSSAAEALQGRIAGVQAIASEGAPGADIIIRVRGGGSITQDNNPLYIVDGIQVDNALSIIPPQDIASVDVLKDASTTAIYGARGANGVVIITTKSGRSGKTNITYNGSFGGRKLTRFMDVLSPYDFVRWQYERSRSSAADSSNFAQTYGTTWDTLSNYKNVPAINWQEEVFGRSASFQNHNLSLSGGSDKTSFNLSLTANREDGILLQSGYDRNVVNFKLDHKATNKLKVGFTARYIDQTIDGAGTTNSGTRVTNRLRHTINYRPFELATSAAGGIDEFDEAYYIASAGATNPVLLTKAEYREQTYKATLVNGYANYNILKNLVFRTTLGYEASKTQTNQFNSRITNLARNFASLPVASIDTRDYVNMMMSNTLQYTKNKIKGHHDFSALIGQEMTHREFTNGRVETRYFPADITPGKALSNMGLGTAPSGSAQPLPTSYISAPDRISSVFGRITYGYDDKYLLTLNTRADRSSKFSSDNGSLVFPSGSVAWRFSKEKFMENVKWIDDAKIRYGYGTVGNNRIGDFLYLQLYGVTGQYAFNHSIVPGFSPAALSNPNLKWEKNITSNFGLDLNMFRNRIQFTMDVYKNTANDLLLQRDIPPTLGYAFQFQNAGSTSNRGVEFQLNTIPVSKKDFTWNSNFNISFNRNRVENLGGINEIQQNSGWQGSDGVADYLVKVGQPLGLMYGFVTDGFYKIEDFNYNPTTSVYTLKPGIASNPVYGAAQPGMLKWKDLDGDGTITADKDRKIIGNANAKFSGGWNNQFSYKAFDMSIFVNFVVGNDVYNANKMEWTDGAFAGLNMLDIMKNRWTNINDQGQVVTDPTALAALNANATIWSPVRVQRWWLHSWAVEDGSYLRINNLTLGYTLPKKLTAKAKISNLRLYGTVNNLATITGYTGYDPDVTARRANPLTPGVDFAAYPRSRTMIIGLNVTF